MPVGALALSGAQSIILIQEGRFSTGGGDQSPGAVMIGNIFSSGRGKWRIWGERSEVNMLTMRKLRSFGLLGIVGLLMLLPVGCGGGDNSVVIFGPGFVGLDDRPTVAITAPELQVEFISPGVVGTFSAQILSDQPLDGDIKFDPVSGTFFITQGPSTLFFGIDSAISSDPESRAFLDFPLDGSTGGDVVPIDAIIVSATLIVSVDFVDFATTVPVVLDLIEYRVPTGLTAADFDSVSLEFQLFNIFASDTGNDVLVDVTAMMEEVQLQGLDNFQVRFSLGP